MTLRLANRRSIRYSIVVADVADEMHNGSKEAYMLRNASSITNAITSFSV